MTDEELNELDRAVARAVGLPEEECDDPPLYLKFQPTRNPADWGPLIERYAMTVLSPNVDAMEWAVFSAHGGDTASYGPTPAIAICRAVVAIGEAREGAA